MAPNSRMRQAKKSFLRRMGGLFIGAMLLTQAGAVWASYIPPSDNQAPPDYSMPSGSRYRPPADSEPISDPNPGTTGSRGACEDATEGSLPLLTLAPQSHAGQSTSQRPTFVWFVPDSHPYPIEVNIYQDNNGATGELVHSQTISQSSQGLMSTSLSPNHPGLTPGERYIWQVVVLCNPNSPSSSAIAQAPIDIVELPADIATQLANASTPSERITIYAQHGLWYDAFKEAQSSSNTETIALLQDLAGIEAQRNPEFANYLHQLIATLQG